MSAGDRQPRQLRPEEVDDFDELLAEALDDFENPNLLNGALTRGQEAQQQQQQKEQQQKPKDGQPSVEALRQNASTADLLKPLAGLSFDSLRGTMAAAGRAGASGDSAAGDDSGEGEGEEGGADFDRLMSRLESDFGQLDKAVQGLLEPSPEDENDPEVRRLKAELRGFAAKVDTANPAELGEALAATLRSLDESVSAHSRHADAVHLPRPDAAGGSAESSPAAGSSEEALMPFMENLMHTLLSKDVIYPSLRAIREGYPAWMERNAGSISQAELAASRKRLEVIGQVCEQYEALGDAKPSDDQFDRILRLVQRMQSLGPPPEELLGDKDLPSVMPQCPQM